MRTLLLAALPLALSAQSIVISAGAQEHQVYQRGSDGKATVTVSGTADGAEGKPVTGKLGSISATPAIASGGKWTVTFAGVPAGGPYKLEMRAGGARAVVQNLFVGDIWMLAGQSNMEGVGNLDAVAIEPPNRMVQTFDMIDEKWQPAKEPLHNIPGSVDKIHWTLARRESRLTGPELAEFVKNRKKGAGLGLPFAVAYSKAAGVPVGLLPCAHGGTSMDQWDPAKWDKAAPGDSLYGSAMRRLQAAGGKIKGILWYQGESDANPKVQPAFRAKFENLVARFRADTGDNALPFYYVQIGRHVNAANVEAWNMVQEDQRLAEQTIANSAVFGALDVDLDDGIHVGTSDLKRIGANMAAFAAGKAKRGPRPQAPVVEFNTIRVKISDFNGTLASAGRPTGFAILDAAGVPQPMIYKTELAGDTIVLHFQGKLPEGAQLRYGHGKDPYANIRDGAGFGLIAFGPVPIR
ncbi:MAG: sialate O-acetylesterase [Bryobacteraceae bacterium]|nr:sialate O-acetylesterase [Bryobacteraceae bacterium]